DLVTTALRLRTPSLLNQGNGWNEDYVQRDQPVKRVTLPGALDIQDYFDRLELIGGSVNPLAYAPHLKTSPLPGIAAKPVLFQFPKGDRTMPNLTSSALIRAANGATSAGLYRHDRVRVVDPSLPVDPHPYLVLFVSLEGDSIKLPDLIGLAVS